MPGLRRALLALLALGIVFAGCLVALVSAGALAYTGDTGPSPAIVELARGATLFLAEASFPEQVPAPSAGYLSSARQAGRDAARAGVGQLLLTHLLPGTAPGLAEAAARATFTGEVGVAHGGIVADLGP